MIPRAYFLGSKGGNSTVDVRVESSGIFFVLVRGFDTGKYALRLLRLNDPAGAVSVGLGDTVTGSVELPGEVDVYNFKAQAGDVVRIRTTTSIRSDLKLVFEVFNSDGALVGKFNNTDLKVEDSGTFSLLMSDGRGNEIGVYLFNLSVLNDPEVAEPVGFRETVTASLETTVETDVYSFEAKAGYVVRIRMTRLTLSGLSFDPRIEVINADGTLLGRDTDRNLATVDVQVGSTGTFFALLSNGIALGSGEYALRLLQLNDLAEPVPLASGEPVVASVDERGEMDVYSFDAQAGDVVRIRMKQLETALEPRIEVFDSKGRILVREDSSTVATVSVQVEASGTFFIILSDQTSNVFGNYGTGSYEVSLLRLQDLLSGAVSVGFEETVAASIDVSGEFDVYSFEAQAGHIVRIRITRDAGSDVRPRVHVFNSDSTLLTSADRGTQVNLDMRMESSGTFFILMNDQEERRTGGYKVSLLRLDDLMGATPLEFDNPVAASLDTHRETDVYSFEAQVGDVVRIRMAVLGRTIQLPRVEVFDSEGTLLGRLGGDFGQEQATVDVRVTNSGTFFVLMSGQRRVSNGRYLVYLQRLNDLARAVPLVVGETVTASLDAPGETDVYRFEAEVGRFIQIRTTELVRTVQPRVDVFDEEGTLMAGRIGVVQDPVFLRPTISGTFFIAVSDLRGNGTGEYEVTLVH